MIKMQADQWYFYANCSQCYATLPLMEDVSKGQKKHRITVAVEATCPDCGKVQTLLPGQVQSGHVPPAP